MFSSTYNSNSSMWNQHNINEAGSESGIGCSIRGTIGSNEDFINGDAISLGSNDSGEVI